MTTIGCKKVAVLVLHNLFAQLMAITVITTASLSLKVVI